MQIYVLFFLSIILGGSVASFIFVFMERGKQKKSFLKMNDRSVCNSCFKPLKWYELIPILSFIFIKGKCQKCEKDIPKRYLFGEIALGVWFASSLSYTLNIYNFDILNSIFLIHLLFIFLFGSLFLILVLQDLDNMEVSSNFLYLLVCLGILFSIFNMSNIYALLVFLPFWVIYFLGKSLKKDLIGEADPYVFSALALVFGSQFSISLFLYTTWFGAIYGVLYLYFVNNKFERNVKIPFLPIIFFSSIFILFLNFHIVKIQDILFLNETIFK